MKNYILMTCGLACQMMMKNHNLHFVIRIYHLVQMEIFPWLKFKTRRDGKALMEKILQE